MHRLLLLVLCCLVTVSCTPPKPEVTLDATTKEAYERSLIQMSSGLSSNERTALSEAISIIQTSTEGMSQVSEDANSRIKVAGKNRLQIIDEAKSIVLEYFEIYDELKEKIHVTVKRKPSGRRLNNRDGDMFDNTDVKVINNSRWDIELSICSLFPPNNTDSSHSIFISGNHDVRAGELAYLDGSSRGTPFKDNQECTQIQLLILGRLPNSRRFGEKDLYGKQIDDWNVGDQPLFNKHSLYSDFLQHIGHSRKSNR